MPDNHDKRYKKLFSDRTLVRQLLESYVKEDFVHGLDFDNMEQVNRSFVTRRHIR